MSAAAKRFRKAAYVSGCPVYCCYCMLELTFAEATVEHVVPEAWGGSNRRSNFLIACRPCNRAVGRDVRLLGIPIPYNKTHRFRYRKKYRAKRRFRKLSYLQLTKHGTTSNPQ